MTTHRVLASTVSHKREPLLPTLEVFARLGLRDLDLNLHHLVEGGVPVDTAAKAIAAGDHHVWAVSGGWCDFFHRAPEIEQTFSSVDRQVRIARDLGVGKLRLFFGRLKYEHYDSTTLETISRNLRRLSDQHPEMLFVFENHDGASLHPAVCREILETVGRPNIRMNFDPINFEKAGARSAAALEVVRPVVAHVHLKGLDHGEYCEFGVGDVDLVTTLRSLVERGYQGDFTVEYEGTFDRTLRLYESVHRARSTIRNFAAAG